MAEAKRVQESLNKQINEEMYASYLYLAMANVLQDMGLDGCCNWMKKQSTEEYQHALKIYDYLISRRWKIKLLPIAAPKQDWRAPLHIFEEAMRHEQKVTSTIHSIYEMAMADKDYPTVSFLQWFIDEQVEEEASVFALVDKLRKMQSTDIGVIMFDAELAKRES